MGSGRPRSTQYSSPPVTDEQNAQIIKPVSILSNRPKSNQYTPTEVQSSFYNQEKEVPEKVTSKGVPLLPQIRQEPVVRSRPRGVSDAEPPVDGVASIPNTPLPSIPIPTIPQIEVAHTNGPPAIPPKSPKKPTEVAKKPVEDKEKREKQDHKKRKS